MMKSVKSKLFASLSVGVMSLSVVLPSFVGIAQADTTKTVYIDIEKNVLNGDLLLEPVAVTLSDTATILDATKEAYGDTDVDATYGYVAAFADAETTDTYAYTSAVSTATGGLVYRTDIPNQPIVDDSDWLREQEYNGISGWMFTVNNATMYGGSNYYLASTPLSALPDGAVIRWEFSGAAGADLGMDNVNLPTQVAPSGWYDWANNTVYFAPRFTRADKTELIRAMADNSGDQDYPAALNVLKDLDSTQSEVNTAVAAL